MNTPTKVVVSTVVIAAALSVFVLANVGFA